MGHSQSVPDSTAASTPSRDEDPSTNLGPDPYSEASGGLLTFTNASLAFTKVTSCGTRSSSTTGEFQNNLIRQTRSWQKISSLTYEQFLVNIKELNRLSSHFLDFNGKQLVFAVKKGTDSTFLWKATVKIACVKVDAETRDVESYKTLNLKEFLQVFCFYLHMSHILK